MELLNSIIADVNKNGFNAEKIVADLKTLREQYKEIKMPLLVKTCRLIYEYIEENGEFDVDIMEEERTEEDGSSLAYLLTLMTKPDNEYNVEEIREYNEMLA